MTACCYAACGREASDNGDRGPGRRRGARRGRMLIIVDTQVHCWRMEAGRKRGRTFNKWFLMAAEREMSDQSPGIR